jgi:hypothetical protein
VPITSPFYGFNWRISRARSAIEQELAIDDERIRSEIVELLSLEMQLECKATAGELRAYDERHKRISELEEELGNVKRAA